MGSLIINNSFNNSLDFVKGIPEHYIYKMEDKYCIASIAYLYVFQINPNRLKAGRTDNIVERMVCHNRNNQLYAGKSIEKLAVFGPFNKNHIKAYEKELLEILYQSQKFIPLDIGNEWFLGNFNDMVSITNGLDFKVLDHPLFF